MSLILNNRVQYSKKYLQDIINQPFQDTYEPPHQLGPDYVIPSEICRTAEPGQAIRLNITETGPSSEKPQSIVSLFEKTVKKYPQEYALSVKRHNIWIHWTYAKYWEECHVAAKAFIKLGLERFHAVGILGFNSPEWCLSNFGAILAGGLSTGLYMTNSASACEYILQHSRANIVVVDGPQQLKKILDIRDNLPHLKAIVQYTGTPTHEDVFSWEDFMKIGSSVQDEVLQRRIKNLAINQCCSIIYTSGTTGRPKAVMLNHDNLTFVNLTQTDFGELFRNQIVVSYLPQNHVAGQELDMYRQILFGGQTNFAQPDALKGSLIITLREVCPTVFVGVPRIFEKMKENIENQLASKNWFTRSIIFWAMDRCRQSIINKINGNPNIPYGYNVAKRIAIEIQKQLGLHRASTLVFCGGAPLSLETIQFFNGLNMSIFEGYGMSESAGVQVYNTIIERRLQSVGKCSQNEVKLIDQTPDGQGEVLMKSRKICMGYMFDKITTEETIDEDGWLHSGDLGYMDKDGFLFITGRIKELIITTGGENIAPTPIEEVVKLELPIVSHAVVIGDKRKFLTMLLTLKTKIDLDTLIPLDALSEISIRWCRALGSEVKTVKDIIDGPDGKVMAAIQDGVDRANQKAISNACRIQKWVILPRDFSVEEGELSPTMKYKRKVIQQKYKDFIDKLYKAPFEDNIAPRAKF